MIPTLEQVMGVELKKKPDSRTDNEKMDEVNAILRMNAAKLGCRMSDLQWSRDKGGHIHVRKKSGIMIR